MKFVGVSCWVVFYWMCLWLVVRFRFVIYIVLWVLSIRSRVGSVVVFVCRLFVLLILVRVLFIFFILVRFG